jgi:hypothetical protein
VTKCQARQLWVWGLDDLVCIHNQFGLQCSAFNCCMFLYQPLLPIHLLALLYNRSCRLLCVYNPTPTR